MVGVARQFVAFGTDIVGIERFLRLIQASLAILTAYPSLPLRPPAPAPALARLQTQLNLTRRTVRLFWFLDNLRASAGGRDGWLGVLAQSAFGLFGLVESATLLDLAGAGVTLLGAREAQRLDDEAQVLWLVALCASAALSASRLLALYAYRAVPLLDQDGGDEKMLQRERDGDDDDDDDDDDMKQQKKKELEQRKAAAADAFAAEAAALATKLLADLLDTLLPASRIGLVALGAGPVGVAMLGSTLLSGWAVWNRCGRQLRGA
ncbi:hypothetical protein CDD83_6764 [Cordyceps sp. RAO-2017]|nr:hypothetical protein CDD83_6764 [Cordyceps sp. RAO-2017]